MPQNLQIAWSSGVPPKRGNLSVISILAHVSSFPSISCVVWDGDKNENSVLGLLIGISTI